MNKIHPNTSYKFLNYSDHYLDNPTIMKKTILLFLLLFVWSSAQILSAQKGTVISDNSTATPDPSAVLDVVSSERGVLIPRMTTPQRIAIANPANGLLVYDLSTNTFWFFQNGTWKELVNNGTPSFIQDTDGDTKIQVEEGNNDNLIRFDMAGTERMILYPNRLSLDMPNQNTMIGLQSGLNNSTGMNNTFFGNSTGFSNSTGSSNTLFGTSAGLNINGSNNTLLGAFVGAENTNGSGNVMVGNGAGNQSTGNYNIFIGNDAGFSETGDDKLYIENSNSSSPLIYGEFNNDLLRINGTLDINNAYRFPTTDGQDGQVLETDGQGNLTWADGANNTSTSYYSVCPCAFKPDQVSKFLDTDAGQYDADRYISNGEKAHFIDEPLRALIAPVNLPHNAILTQWMANFKILYTDITIKLKRQLHTHASIEANGPPSPEVLATITQSTDLTPTYFSETTGLNHTIDNQNYYYYIEVEPTQWNNAPNGGASQFLRSMRLTYIH